MATLEKIRSRGGLVAGVIGTALLVFILTDLVSSGSSLFAGKRLEVAEINGKSVDYQDYDLLLNQLTEVYKLQQNSASVDEQTLSFVRNQVWDQVTRTALLTPEYLALGVAVHGDEIFDMVQGKNIHPTIKQMFTDPQTGQFNKAAVINFLKNKDQDPRYSVWWDYMEKQMISERAFSKYKALVGKGLVATTLEAKQALAEQSKKVDITFVAKNYSTVPDSIIKIADSDLEAYYDEHIEEFMQDESRTISYVAFEVTPSNEDYKDAEDWSMKTKAELANVEEVAQFVKINSDTPFSTKYVGQDELPKGADSILFNAEPGFVFGPWFENESFRLAKVVDVKQVPDSVHARHILIAVKQGVNMDQAKAKADSIKSVLDKGGDFAKLASDFSDDPGSKEEGGDLKWFAQGMMVQQFNDACFFNKTGDVQVVETRFGAHIIEILDQSAKSKKVQVAYVDRKLEPSTETYRKVFAAANQFAGVNTTPEQFKADADKNKIKVSQITNITPDRSNLPGLDSPRELVRWVYQAEKDDISGPMELGDKFVIAHLSAINPKGYAPLEQVKNQIELEVYKKLKAEKIIAEFKAQGASNVAGLASALNLAAGSASDISFSSFSISGMGAEPKAIAAAVSTENGSVSAPIAGANGVYVVEVTKSVQAESTKDAAAQTGALTISLQNRASYTAYQAIKDKAQIVDRRYKFY